MSIFSSWAAPDDSDHEDGCASYVELVPGFLEFSGKPCDCGQPDAPLVYKGSHVLPSETDERGGQVDIAAIPSFITRDGRDDRSDDEGPWPFLRFGVNESTVILTPRTAGMIRDTLNEWLAAVADPPETA